MTEELNSFLKPVTDLLPQGVQDFLNGGGWWVVLGVLALIVLLILLALVGAVWRALFARKRPPPDLEAKLREDLATYPPPAGPSGPRRLTVEGVPGRLRLIVLAPVGKESRIDPAAAELLLDHVVQGLGAIIKHDRPQVRVWPQQLSNQGFGVVFHRAIRKPEPEGKPSRWTLIAGRTPPNRPPLLIGLVLYTDQPTKLGRLTIEPDRWADVLRIKTREG